MSFFSATIEAALAGRRVRFAYLVEFRVLPNPVYLWTGVGSLPAGGHTWLGLQQLGAIEGIEESLNGQSAQMRLTISGAKLTSQLMVTAASENRAGYLRKLVIIWLQFFDDDWALLDSPYAVQAGLIDGMPMGRDLQAADGSIVRSLSVTAENIFYTRRIAPNSYYTDSSQRQKYSVGGGGLQFVPGLQDKTIGFPF